MAIFHESIIFVRLHAFYQFGTTTKVSIEILVTFSVHFFVFLNPQHAPTLRPNVEENAAREKIFNFSEATMELISFLSVGWSLF